jgi:hypothetical protein
MSKVRNLFTALLLGFADAGFRQSDGTSGQSGGSDIQDCQSIVSLTLSSNLLRPILTTSSII